MATHQDDVNAVPFQAAGGSPPLATRLSRGQFAERAEDLKKRLFMELAPRGLVQEIVVSALAQDAAAMELGMAAENASWEFASQNAKVVEALGGVSTDKSTLVTAMGSEHVARASRYRLDQQRAFCAGLKTWSMLEPTGQKLPALSLFADEDACAAYLAAWQEDQPWMCAACGDHERWLLAARGKFECRCGQQQSIRDGTIFARSHTPLSAWFDLTTALVIDPQSKANDMATHLRMVRLSTIRAMIKKVTAVLADPNADQQLAGLPAYIESHLRKVYVLGTELPPRASVGGELPLLDDHRLFSSSTVRSRSPRRPR